MPGLSQLQKFNSDILSLGEEPTLRAQRGEQALTVPLPKGVKDYDDSDDFVIGMPVVLNNVEEQKKEELIDDEDFSDITGEKSNDKDKSSVQVDSNQIPDFSDLLTPSVEQDDNGSVPDLSMFLEPVIASEPEEEIEPEEPAIADLNLEDLLNSAGFDSENEATDEYVEDFLEELPSEDDTNVEEVQSADIVSEDLEVIPDTNISNLEELSSFDESAESSLDELSSFGEGAESSLDELSSFGEGAESSLDELSSVDEGAESSLDELSSFGEGTESSLDELSSFGEGAELSLDELSSFGEGAESSLDELSSFGEGAESSLDELSSFGEGSESSLDELSSVDEGAESSLDELSSFDDVESNFELSEENTNETSAGDGFDSILEDFGELESIPTMPDEAIPLDLDSSNEDENLETVEDDESGENLDSLTEEDFVINNSFEASDVSLDSLPDLDAISSDFSSTDMDSSDLDEISSFDSEQKSLDDDLDDLDGIPAGLFNADDVEVPELDDSMESNFDAFDSDSKADDGLEVPDFSMDSPEELGSELDSDDFGASDDLNLPDESESSDNMDFSSDFPSDFDFNLDESADDNQEVAFDTNEPIEQFDTSQMDGLDFGIPDTDSQISEVSSDFELGNSADFGIDNGEFEIPGFSDVETVATNKDGKIKRPVSATEQDEINQKNSLTDEQYEKFLKNLSSYPLNVRIAVEELIVKNEFTDDAEFDIIQKVLKKISARQLASELERMLDISILVPRDFERRTAEEYEAYKASFQYQLRNKIIPGAILGIVAFFVCFALVIFARNFVYNPLRASYLYRQGYSLIQNDEFAQSEIEFNKAAKYKLIKNWFYKYADAYRLKKQYIRAEQMYKITLRYFNHDKKAGINYTEMELYDLANYEKAENIALREILDHHINDPDGILLLGDVYLEWATEKDPSKFEEARIRYAELIQLYGESDLYLSRMMRYFIRTDKLLEVLRIKQSFMNEKKPIEKTIGKALASQDLTELSGYLLDKQIGYLPPSEEYLRGKIEDVKDLLVCAVKADEKNPTSLYNLSRYYVNRKDGMKAKSALEHTVELFDKLEVVKKKDVYNQIDTYRLLGEEYIRDKEYLKAQEVFTQGIVHYTSAHDLSGLKGTENIGKLYTDMGDINYFITGDLDSALQNYKDSIELSHDTPHIRYKIGYIQYGKRNYAEALGSFMKSNEIYSKDMNLLLAMGNTLSLRNDNFAAQGYYNQLIDCLDTERIQKGFLSPQTRSDDAEIVDMYLKASNNAGVTMYKLAKRTGNSNLNAKAIVQFQQSMRAWDYLTRNQKTMVRLNGSNLAEQNIRYVTHPVPNFEPAIYTDISRTLSDEKGLVE